MNTLQRSVWILSLIGIALASYLLLMFVTHPAIQPCSLNATVNCDAVTKGEIALFLGIPVPAIGLVGYICILLGALFKNNRVILSMSAFGLAFCLRLLYLEIFVLHVICPVCVACFIVMSTIFVLGLWLTFKGKNMLFYSLLTIGVVIIAATCMTVAIPPTAKR